MANFYGEIKSSSYKTSASRRGHKDISAHIRTWTFGVEVYGEETEFGNEFIVYQTGGSNNASHRKELLRLREDDNGDIKLIA